MEEKMSRWGIGPMFAFLSLGYGLITLSISCYFHPFFQMGFFPYRIVVVLGVLLIGIGLPFFFISVKTVTLAYQAEELVTGGIFTCCRHPLYASWVVFIVPGVALSANSWILLTTPVVMYVVLRLLVGKEESYLGAVFGPEYLEYKKRVPCIVPIGWIKSKV
jgi:protein-S-isoprenylcysteine O-methyltransferase Ste14